MDESYWQHWPSIDWNAARSMKSKIDPSKLESLARETCYPYTTILESVVRDIREGASIGVAKEHLVPSRSSNAPSAYDNGHKVSDALCKMMQEGFIMGPFSEGELPFDKTRISGLMVKLKPDGSARMILNLSKGIPSSVNEGIRAEDFPTKMSSTYEFVRVLNRGGKNAEMTKVDWASAYKQIRVRESEVWQQGFQWLGKTFFELCLVFGASSSAGLFDRLAKVVLHIVLAKSNMPRRCVIQHLDDVCSVSPWGTGRALNFYNGFKSVCEDLGVKLAPPGDKDKEFGPSQQGVVLGVFYNTVSWTWSIKEEKLTIILNKLQDCIENETMKLR